MTTYQLPIENAAEDGAFLTTYSLDGIDYQFVFQFNEREGFWYVDINDVEGNPIRSGIKIVANFPLLLFCQCMVRPAGEPACLNTEDEPVDPGLEELGVDAILCYIDEEGLA